MGRGLDTGWLTYSTVGLKKFVLLSLPPPSRTLSLKTNPPRRGEPALIARSRRISRGSIRARSDPKRRISYNSGLHGILNVSVSRRLRAKRTKRFAAKASCLRANFTRASLLFRPLLRKVQSLAVEMRATETLIHFCEQSVPLPPVYTTEVRVQPRFLPLRRLLMSYARTMRRACAAS